MDNYTLKFPATLVKCLGRFVLEVEYLRIRKADQSGLLFKQPSICLYWVSFRVFHVTPLAVTDIHVLLESRLLKTAIPARRPSKLFHLLTKEALGESADGGPQFSLKALADRSHRCVLLYNSCIL